MRIVLVFIALVALVILPFLFKPKQDLLAHTDDVIVIITPNNEAIRYEFSRAFADWYLKKTGRTIRIDWRVPGGTNDIVRYIRGSYYAAFEYFWKSHGNAWTAQTAAAFDNPKVAPTDTPGQAARKAFLASNVGIGLDLFFGGGSYDFIQQANAGRLVDCGVIKAHPESFTPDSIPVTLSGEPFYDPQGRWLGTVLSGFGICYNTDSLRRLGIPNAPLEWIDLCDPRYLNQVALANPTMSGSAAKAFEMIIQQQMQEIVRQAGAATPDALNRGWEAGLRVIQRTSGNSRYFTDSGARVPVDVSQGEAAAGMCIDFYGRFQSQAVQVGDAPSRLQYVTPRGGSSVGVDPIGLFRGAPHADAARLFIEFVMSIEGQKLWDFKVGTPGGPVRYALRRLPIRKQLYEPQYTTYRSDPTVNPYDDAKYFTYHSEWTGSLFKVIGFVIRVTCIDTHEEQESAWRALIAAHFPPQATAKFDDLSAVSYPTAMNSLRQALSSGDPIASVRLADTLDTIFRNQYKEAEALAKQGK